MKRVILIALVAVLPQIQGCDFDSDGFLGKLFKGGGSAVPVTVEGVTIRDKDYRIKVPATIEPSKVEEITFPKEITVEKVLVSVGDKVSVGDPLFQISEMEIKNRIAKLQEDLRDAKADIDKNMYLFNNRDRLIEEGRIEQSQYDDIEPDLDAAEQRAEKVQAELTRLTESPSSNSITSSARGVVSEINAAVGTATPAGKALIKITKVDPLTARFELASYESSAISNGMGVTVRLPDLSAESIHAKITKIDPTIDPELQTFKVWAEVPNANGHLKVGMSAEVEFVTPKKQRFYLIPAEALIRERRRHYVFTVINGIAHKVEVVPKEKVGSKIEIAKGLREDDLVVVKGNEKLTEGTVLDIWGR
ncbi:MAG: efflux RND transporter periplasmic adaptor subunit [Myxococcales bacterium]|nr:efflux RND transporter periplasmic adaptor subunit [Myxococcales bacterium]